jgi:hypothetical protein
MINCLSKRPELLDQASSLPAEENSSFLELMNLFQSKLSCLASSVNCKGAVKRTKKVAKTKPILEREEMPVDLVDLPESDESDYCDLQNKFATLAVNC